MFRFQCQFCFQNPCSAFHSAPYIWYVGYPVVVLFSKSLVCYLESDSFTYSFWVRPRVHNFMRLLSELLPVCDLSPWYLPVPLGSPFGLLARKLRHSLPCSALYFPCQCLCHTRTKWKKDKGKKKSESGSAPYSWDEFYWKGRVFSLSFRCLWIAAGWGVKKKKKKLEKRKKKLETSPFSLSTRPHSYFFNQTEGLLECSLFTLNPIPCFGFLWVQTGRQWWTHCQGGI